MPFSVQGVVDKRLQGDVLALAIGHVRRKDDARSAGHDAISKRLRSESGKNDRVDCADAGACEHEQNGFGAGGHRQCDSIALLDAEASERCGHTHYFMQELRVGEYHTVAAFVEIHKGSPATLAFGDVTVDRVIGEVGFSADEPAERRRIRLVDFVPRAEPVQLARSPFPEGDGIASPVFDPSLNFRCR